MGYISDEELGTLRVTRMIIHVVGRPEQSFVPEREIEVQQEGFFRARIISESRDGVHSYNYDSAVKYLLERMAQNTISFEAGGQELARRFREFHVRQSVSGAFFVMELRTDSPTDIFFALIKYDYSEAVELIDQNGRSVLREIIQAFIKDRRAIQKFCISRVSSGVAHNFVSASDRMKEAPDLTDYFERYLDVSRSRSSLELSRRLNESLRSTAESVKEDLPGRDVGRAVAVAKSALEARATVTNDDVVDALLHAADRPDDEEIRRRIDRTARRILRRNDLHDVEFRPDRRTLQTQPRRFVRTAEEVRLEYPAEELGQTVFRQDTPTGVVITIRPSRLIEDGTRAERPR